MEQPARAQATLSLTLLTMVALTASCTPDLQFQNPYKQAFTITGGDARQGKEAIGRYGCGSCHTIPGVGGANGLVGPPLTKMALRTYIAGVLPNSPANMQRWIADPPAVDPLTAMPKLGISGRDLQDITSYLYTLR
jgi:cytochrome c1